MGVEPKRGKALELLTAIAQGEAEMEDGLAELKREGVSSLEEALRVIKDEAAQGKRSTAATRPDFASMRRKAPQSVVAKIKHVVPEVPFVFDGTLYDPADIERFNGRELHFFTSPDQEHMLAVDDRDLMTDWLQFEYFQRYRDVSSHSMKTHESPHATWWEHDDLWGYAIGLTPNLGYWRLSEVSLGGGLFADNWNDKISSFEMWSIGVVQLSDEADFMGPFFYHVVPPGGYASVTSLRPYGWNDRASSCGDW